MGMTAGSLFAGIGGIDLGLERAGFEIRWQCEIDEFATRVLEHHWPEVQRHRDVREVGKHNLEPVDLIAGGFPCQDISVAGRGRGITGERSGLWFEYLRIVRELRPAWVLAENVPALRTRGADVVLDGLAEAGYSAWPLVVGARHVAAPHRRDRVWIVAKLAHTDREPRRAEHGEPPSGARGPRPEGSGTLARGAGAGWGESRRAVDARARGAGPLDEPTGTGEGREPAGVGLADSGCSRLEGHRTNTGCAEVAKSGHDSAAGVGLAHASRDESERRRGSRDVARAPGAPEADAAERERLRDAAFDRSANVGVGLADPDGHRREGERCGGLLDGEWSAQRHDADRCHRWPARPGEQQHDWEEPRTTEPPVGGATSRLSERLAGRHRRASLKALGNSVVPQVVEAIGRAIVEVQHA